MSTRRRQLLDAALECFTARGYAATTIEDIRRSAGASVGSLYHHFDGKEALATALYFDRLSGYEAGYIEVLRQAADARHGIRGVVAHHLQWAEDHRDSARFLLGHSDLEVALVRSGQLPEDNVRFYATVQTWLRGHIDDGSICRLPAELFYALWLGPSQEITRQWLVGRVRTRPTDATELLGDAAWSTLSAR